MGAVIRIVSVDHSNRRAIARFARRAELVGLHAGVVGTEVGFANETILADSKILWRRATF